MEAVMGLSSYSPYLKLLSNNTSSLKHDLPPFHHLPYSVTNKAVNIRLSVSFSASDRGVRPVSLSSSHAQAEIDDHALLIESSPNGYTIEAETQTVRVQFRLQRECSFGQNFLITGDHPILGLWDPNNAVPLTWSDGHVWTADLDIPVGKCIKFKLIMQESDGKFVWQPGPDRVLKCFQTEKIITLCEDWENPDSRIITETDPTMNQEIQCVESSVDTTVTQEAKEYVLVSDEVVPVLVPGLSQLSANEGPDDDPEPVNGAAMVSTGPDTAKVVSGLSQPPVNEGPRDEPEPVNGTAVVSAELDMAKDLTLPELDSKEDIANTLNSNPRPEISPIQENQEPCENKHQDNQESCENKHQQNPESCEDIHQENQESCENIHQENQESCGNKYQEMQVAEEEDNQDTQPVISLLHNDIRWSNNIMQKLLNIFGIQ